MRNPKLALLACVALASSVLISGTHNGSVAAVGALPTNMDELKVDRMKVLSKRDPRAEELVKKAEAYVQKLKQSNPTSPYLKRLEESVEHISMGSSALSDPALKVDMELLELIGKDHKEPSAEELAPLQERYKKICANFDDMIFTKDLDRAFHIHDKFVRFTSVGVWDKDKMSSELERMETLIEKAPDIAFGKAQLYDTTKNKRLVSLEKLVYVGTSPHEQMYLTSDRRSAVMVEPSNWELAEHIVQAPDGKMTNLNDCNVPSLGMPFSPPISLWAKSRIQEGHVPAVLLKVVDNRVRSENTAYASAKSQFLTVGDIAEGKMDDYLKTNVKLLGPDKSPAMLGLLQDFDREAAATAFGADGHTPYYSILDPKLKDMPEAKRLEEVKKRCEKGAYSGKKGMTPELCNQYGDKAIPDGPERVRDAWKRAYKIVTESGGTSINLFSSAGAFHANKNAGKFPGEQDAGNQEWNKLEYYWPGENVLDWIGVNAIGTEPISDPKGANLMEAIDAFMGEVRSSSWQATPVLLVEPAPSHSKSPLAEATWIKTLYTKMIGPTAATFPNIRGVFIGIPDAVTLWTPEARSAYRSYVTSDKAYNFKMRFKSL
jgi:hypothetical protein